VLSLLATASGRVIIWSPSQQQPRVLQGLQQAQDISAKFALPPQVLSRVLNSGYLPSVRALVAASGAAAAELATTTTSPTSSLPPLRPSAALAESSCGGAGIGAGVGALYGAVDSGNAAQPPVGSPEWRAQLERIRDVCRKAQVDHRLIDGFLAASCPEPPDVPLLATQCPLGTPALLRTSSHASEAPVDQAPSCVTDPWEGPCAADGLDLAVHSLLLDTNMVGDDLAMPAWAP
jgi:hypothetical protein